MKKLLLTLSITLLSIIVFSQNVGIGTNTPNTSAKLEVTSTNSGFLPPRMTFVQRNAILNPAQGLMVYQTDSAMGLYSFNGALWLLNIATIDNRFYENIKRLQTQIYLKN